LAIGDILPYPTSKPPNLPHHDQQSAPIVLPNLSLILFSLIHSWCNSHIAYTDNHDSNGLIDSLSIPTR